MIVFSVGCAHAYTALICPICSREAINLMNARSQHRFKKWGITNYFRVIIFLPTTPSTAPNILRLTSDVYYTSERTRIFWDITTSLQILADLITEHKQQLQKRLRPAYHNNLRYHDELQYRGPQRSLLREVAKVWALWSSKRLNHKVQLQKVTVPLTNAPHHTPPPFPLK